MHVHPVGADVSALFSRQFVPPSDCLQFSDNPDFVTDPVSVLHRQIRSDDRTQLCSQHFVVNMHFDSPVLLLLLDKIFKNIYNMYRFSEAMFLDLNV